MQFGGELDAEYKQALAEIEAQITRELATRDFTMAKHFDDIEEYGSAKFYYGQVVKNYPSTPLADQSRERLAALGGEPDRPEPKLAWLIDMVPESSERLAVKQVPLIEDSSLTPPGANEPMMAERPEDATTPQGGCRPVHRPIRRYRRDARAQLFALAALAPSLLLRRAAAPPTALATARSTRPT